MVCWPLVIEFVFRPIITQDIVMDKVEIILYTTIFSSLLTTLLAIALKRFDSRESKLNREYERKTILRNKFEEMYKLVKKNNAKKPRAFNVQ